ncbi:UNVERIFIED_CONTAM: hypothetical protein K2H54_038116 [Gekko kuhli]
MCPRGACVSECVWAFLVSRIDARDPGKRAGPREGDLWDQLTGLRVPLHDAWTGLRADVGTERALVLEVTERLLASRESRARSGEPPAWLSLSVALQLADIERQLGWHTGSQDTPTLIAPNGVEAREAAGERRGPREHLGSEWWRATLHALLPDLWRTA